MKRRIHDLIKTIILSIMISLSLSNTCHAEVTPEGLQGYLNGVVAQQKINQSNHPKYAERTDTAETIDPMTGNLLLKETDMTFPGKDGLDLSIGRIYNSSRDEFTHKAKVNIYITYTPVLVDAYFIHVNFTDGSHGTFGPYLTSEEAYYYYLIYSAWPDVISVNVTYETKVIYEETRDVSVIDYIDKTDYNESRYNLGAGWSFAFPSVQIYTDNGVRYIYYHDGTGASYRVINTTDTGKSNLEGYQGNDVKFLEDNGTYVNGDNIPSKYKYTASDLTTAYFAADGRLLGIKDRFQNEIKFRHQDRQVHGTAYPLISRIEDSVGRIVNFNYVGNNIEVVVKDPGNTDQVQYTYTRSLATKTANTITGSETYQYYILDSVTDPLNRTTYYENYYYYNNNSWPAERYDLFVKALTNSVDRYLLGAIVYPGSKTIYEYEKITRNLGAYGLSEEFRIKSRYDKIQRLNSSTQTMEWSGKTNQVDYTYGGDCTGYPDYPSDEGMPPSYRFWSEATDSSGRKFKNIFNGSKQLVQTESTAGNNEKEITKHLEFDSTYSFKPTKTEASRYSNSGTLVRTLYTGTTYTSWGGISTVTMPLTAQQYNDPNTKALYTTAYSYGNPAYPYFLTKKQWYQSSTKQLSESYTYDSAGRPAGTTNAKGETTQYTYTHASGHKTEDTITKTLGGGKTAKTKLVYGSETNYAYPKEILSYYTDDQGTYISTKTTYTYGLLLGLVTTETDNENKTTSYTYDDLGRTTEIRYPGFTSLNGTTYAVRQTYEYLEGYNNEYIEGNYTGIYGTTVNACTYYVNQADSTTSLYSQISALYDAYGNLRQERAWDGTGYITKSKYTYDSLQRVKSHTDAENNTLSQTYDAWGRVHEITDASGNLYVSNYNITANKIVSCFVPSSSIEQYRTGMIHNDYGSTWNYTEVHLDQFGRAIQRKAYQNWPDPSIELSERYTYDIAGNLTGYTDPKRNLNEDGVTASYRYDERNRVIQVKDALNQITAVSYDALGNITTVSLKENAQSTASVPLYTKTYDELGSLRTRTDPSAQVTGYSYNSLGLGTKTVDRNGSTLTAAYDGLDRLMTATQTSQDSTKSIGYQYNYSSPFGFDEERMYQNGSATPVTENTYTYDALGQITGKETTGSGYLGSGLELQYDNAGRLTGVGAGIQGSSFYSLYKYMNDRLAKVQTNGSQTVSSSDTDNAAYQYYPDGKLDKITYPRLNDGTYPTTEYLYDTLGRLITMINKKASTVLSRYTYTYDANGNITTVNNGQTTTTYTYDKLNRLVRILPQTGTETSYTYDLKGNRRTENNDNFTGLVNTDYTYQVDNKLASVTKGAATTTMTYYADGMRAKKTTATGTTHYIYNLAGKLIAEADGSNTVTANYVWGPDRALVKKETGGGEYYYLYNGHGDVIQIIDRNGNIVNNYNYDEWGNILTSSETIENPFKYAGEVYDEETGLYYLRARYYDPVLGRFINEDTYEGQINNPLTLNLYTYCINNPLIYVDPTGHDNRFAVSEGGGGGVDPVSLGYVLWEGVKGVSKWVLRGVGIGVASIPVYETVTNMSSSKDKDSSVPTPCPAPARTDTQGAGSKTKTNKGNEIDIAPSSNHRTTTKNPGLEGEPNSSVDILDSKGNIKTRRWYGPNGKQIRDVDFTNHGNPKLHPEWPHEHGPRP